MDNPDDSAVWRIDDNRALVLSTDFFTPVVDDPFDYGSVAASNSLSDIYAMGGQPFLALSIAAFPPDLPVGFLGEILRGGAIKCREAGVIIAGGHTIQDKEPKYGLVVVGFVHPHHILTKGGVQPGDALVLSKPLGFGTTLTAFKQDKASLQDITEAVKWMKILNKSASKLALEFGSNAATDITGFSLIGHAWEMVSASQVGFRFIYNDIPMIEGAYRYGSKYLFPGGAHDNRINFGSHVQFSPKIEEFMQLLLFDPQTSGGLLMSIPQQNLSAMIARAAQINQPLWVIGEAVAGDHIEVV